MKSKESQVATQVRTMGRLQILSHNLRLHGLPNSYCHTFPSLIICVNKIL